MSYSIVPFHQPGTFSLAGRYLRPLLAAAAAGSSLWLIACGGDDASQPPTAAPTATVAPTAAAAPDTSVLQAAPETTLDEVYLVDSAEAAAAVTAELEEANLFRISLGQLPLWYEVVVIETAEDEASFINAHNEANQFRYQQGLPAVELFDRR